MCTSGVCGAHMNAVQHLIRAQIILLVVTGDAHDCDNDAFVLLGTTSWQPCDFLC